MAMAADSTTNGVVTWQVITGSARGSAHRVNGLPNQDAVASQDGQATMMVAYPATGEQDAATNALVDRLRHDVLPKDAYLTGPNAGNVTFANLIGRRLADRRRHTGR